MIKTTKIAFILVSLSYSLVACSSVNAKDSQVSPQILESSVLEAEVKRGMELWHVPGMAIAVVDKESVKFQQGFGKTAIKKGKKVDQHTLFAIASTTKAMVVAGILMLADENKLSLDDLVIKHIPELHFNDSGLTQQITIRDLLAHRTGLPSTDGWVFFQQMPLAEQITKLRHVESAAPVRTRLIYQNTMFELAGLIIERVSGKTWGKFIKQRLWQPIGMKETYAARGAIPKRKKHVLPYVYVERKLHKAEWDFSKSLEDAAGSVWSSIHDMSLWAQFLLNDGVNSKGNRLISKESFEQMFEPHQLASEDDFYPTTKITKPHWRSYGLGWFQQDFQGRKIDFHTGSLSGLIAIIGLDRDNDKAFVALANRDHAETRHALMWYVLDNSPQTEKRDWNKEIFDLYEKSKQEQKARQEKTSQSRIAGTTPGLPLKDYVGTYEHIARGNISIEMNDNELTLVYGKLSFKMKHWHLDTFQINKKQWEFTGYLSFDISPTGKVEKIELFGQEFDRVNSDE